MAARAPPVCRIPQLALASRNAADWVLAHTMRIGVTRKANFEDPSLSALHDGLDYDRVRPTSVSSRVNGFHGVALRMARCVRFLTTGFATSPDVCLVDDQGVAPQAIGTQIRGIATRGVVWNSCRPSR